MVVTGKTAGVVIAGGATVVTGGATTTVGTIGVTGGNITVVGGGGGITVVTGGSVTVVTGGTAIVGTGGSIGAGGRIKIVVGTGIFVNFVGAAPIESHIYAAGIVVALEGAIKVRASAPNTKAGGIAAGRGLKGTTIGDGDQGNGN